MKFGHENKFNEVLYIKSAPELTQARKCLKNNLTPDSLGLVNMERYMIEQCVFNVGHYLKNNES